MPKIVLNSPVRGIQGKFKDSDVCYFMGKNGLTYARSASFVPTKKTTAQQEMQGIFAGVSKRWQTLSAVQREDWKLYSAVYYTKTAKGDPVEPSGKSAFTMSNVTRQILGLPMITEAPTLAPPQQLTTVSALITPNEDQLFLTVTHSIPSIAGLEVIAQMTPAMRTVAETPRSRDMRYVCGLTSASAIPLVASGSSLEYNNTEFAILDGKRYGVELRVVRIADGVTSQPIYGDFIKTIV